MRKGPYSSCANHLLSVTDALTAAPRGTECTTWIDLLTYERSVQHGTQTVRHFACYTQPSKRPTNGGISVHGAGNSGSVHASWRAQITAPGLESSPMDPT